MMMMMVMVMMVITIIMRMMIMMRVLSLTPQARRRIPEDVHGLGERPFARPGRRLPRAPPVGPRLLLPLQPVQQVRPPAVASAGSAGQGRMITKMMG
jgi:hypothetical protein